MLGMCPEIGPASATRVRHSAATQRCHRRPTGSPTKYGDARARLPRQVAMHDVCGLRMRCRGERLPDVATYCRVSVPDVVSCAKTGLFQPSINPAADHETGLAEPKLRQNRRKRTNGTSVLRHF